MPHLMVFRTRSSAGDLRRPHAFDSAPTQVIRLTVGVWLVYRVISWNVRPKTLD